MTTRYDPEDSIEMDKWMRKHFDIRDESTDAYLMKRGYFADTPWGFSQRMTTALAWLKPQVTQQTDAIFEELNTLVTTLYRITNPIQIVENFDPSKRWVPTRAATAEDIASQRLKAELLFEQAKALHRLQPTLDAQVKYKQTQSENAKMPRTVSEQDGRRIAKIYWERKEAGTFYGAVKDIVTNYGVSPTTIRALAKKYKPNKISQ